VLGPALLFFAVAGVAVYAIYYDATAVCRDLERQLHALVERVRAAHPSLDVVDRRRSRADLAGCVDGRSVKMTLRVALPQPQPVPHRIVIDLLTDAGLPGELRRIHSPGWSGAERRVEGESVTADDISARIWSALSALPGATISLEKHASRARLRVKKAGSAREWLRTVEAALAIAATLDREAQPAGYR
jgi:hypothetical protein